jgi:putative colanic acid biosysnthesis UDP-glucose lipid carrier transferase
MTGNRCKPVRVVILMKRALDVLVSVFVIVFVLSWLLPILAVLIRRDSRGQAFFLQKRVGRYGRLFTCLKLRTMYVNEEADVAPATEDDGRITRIGSWLRRSHLDELPQFVNVLLGSMSIVGPRPYMPADCDRYGQIVSDTEWRLQVRPGITGMAQMEGLHGVCCDREIVIKRFECDKWYVDHADLTLDLRIFAGTLFNVLPRRIAAMRIGPSE